MSGESVEAVYWAEKLDACIKCNACTAECPVAGVNPLFPGPKAAGPDAERLRLEGIFFEAKALALCSNCKTCEITCPSSVNITDLIMQARRKAIISETTRRLGAIVSVLESWEEQNIWEFWVRSGLLSQISS